MKVEKKICFRFDVDTHVCLSHGMPALLALAQEEGVSFTFFVNMGKGFDRFNSIKNIIGRLFNRHNQSTSGNLSMFTKLGKKEALVASLINPDVGAKYTKVLQEASTLGHDLGLHGGRNHSHWEKNALYWSAERITAEIGYGVTQFARAKLPPPTSFASPAWQSPDSLEAALINSGFTAYADKRNRQTEAISYSNGLYQTPTNILSDSDDVGFIENYRALGFNHDRILTEFVNQLRSKEEFAMVYEHPFYAGVHELDLLRDMIKASKTEGFTPTTVRDIIAVEST